MKLRKLQTKNIVQIVLLVFVCILLGFAIRSCANADTQDEFVVLSTADMNGKIWYKDVQTGEDEPNNLLAASSAIKDARAGFEDRTITYDNGDLYQNSLIESLNLNEKNTDIVKGVQPCTLAMDEMKYDGYTLGNHEFNYKYSLLQTNYEYIKDRTTLVSANIYDKATGQRLFTPYITKTFKVDGNFFKVGIIGLDNPDCSLWDASSHFSNIQFYAPDNPNADLAYEIKKVQDEMAIADENCDFVIVSMHNGFYFENELQHTNFTQNTQNMLDERAEEPLELGVNTEAQAYRAIKNTTGIDMFICGHDKNDNYSNMKFSNADGSKDVLVVNAASTALTKTVFRANYDKNNHVYNVSVKSSENVPLASYGPDSVLTSRVRDDIQMTINKFAYVPGEIMGNWDIIDNETDYYTYQTDYADFINRAQMWAGYTWSKTLEKTVEDINLKLRADNGQDTKLQFKGPTITPDMSITSIPLDADKKIKNGQFTFQDAKKAYPEDHYLCSVAVTGDEIKHMLEFNAAVKYRVELDDQNTKKIVISGDYRSLPITYGLNFYIDMNKPVGDRVVMQGFSNGRQWNPDEVYCVMVDNYILESNSTYIYELFNWDRVIIEQDLNHNGTYIRHILDLYATQTTKDYGGVFPTEECKKDNEKPSYWWIVY